MPLEKEDIKNTWCHIEGKIIAEHGDEPIRGIDISRDLVVFEVLMQIRKVDLHANFELKA